MIALQSQDHANKQTGNNNNHQRRARLQRKLAVEPAGILCANLVDEKVHGTLKCRLYRTAAN